MRTAAFGAIILCAAVAHCQEPDAEEDPILLALDRAREAHGQSLADARDVLVAAFDAEIKKVAQTGDLGTVEKLQDEKSAFEEDGKMPSSARFKSAVATYQRAIREAATLLEAAYESAVAESTKALKLDQAKAIKDEWEDFRGNKSVVPKPRRDSDAPLLPQEIVTKEQLRKFLAGTQWSWEKESVTLKPDGYVRQAGWDARGVVTRWEAIDRRTVLFVVEKGRANDRIAVLRFADDFSEYNGYDFVARPLIAMKRKP